MPPASRWLVPLFLLLFTFEAPAQGQKTTAATKPADDPSLRTPTPSDLVTYEEPLELALSPDGKTVLLRTRRGNVENNQYASTTWKIPTTPSATSTKLDVPSKATSFEWLPNGNQIAYLAPAKTGRGHQVWLTSPQTDSSRQVTQQRGGVRSFSFSPNGQYLAYTSLKRSRPPRRNSGGSQRGEAIDVQSSMYLQLRGKRLTAPSPSPPQRQLWIKDLARERTTAVGDSLSIQEYEWSPSGNKLALSGKPTRLQAQQTGRIPLFRSDLFIYERKADRLRTVQKGKLGTETVYDGALSYSSPFWGPSGNRLGFLRTDHSDRMASIAEVGLYNVQQQKTRLLTSDDEQDLYSATFHWLHSDQIFVEYTNRGRNGLFRLSPDDGSTTPLHVADDYSGAFSFSANGNRAAWVRESVDHPPEVYTSRSPFDSGRKLTQLNEHLANVWLPSAESVTWTSDDNTIVQGWLIRPREQTTEPAPLLVLLHGGPSWAVRNRFTPYRGGGWLYPVQTFAARGYAVFIPNYRGTGSFGKDFRKPDAPDEEPVSDVLSGIDHLASRGIADSDRVALMGHSHGAWLAPMVAAEDSTIKASSIAEGVGNYLSLYGQFAGWRNRGLHEHTIGRTPYENPDRYLDLSPAFQNNFTKSTPTLLEYGQQGTAIQGVEVAKALWRHDTPHKFIVYPNVGHGLDAPALLVESMKRNLQWFGRWLTTGTSPATSGE